MTQKEIIKKIVKALDSKRAENIQVIKIGDLTILGDYFIIANGTSSTHTKTLADEVEYQLSQEKIEPDHIEKDNTGSWIILDYNDIIVHVFHKEARNFYNLENLWADGEPVDISEYLKKD